MKHCSYLVLIGIKYIRKKLAKDFIFQNPPLQLKMKRGQKVCTNCMKSYQEKLNFRESSDDDKNDGHAEKDPEYIDHKINRTVPSDSATLLGISPIKAVCK